MGDYNYNNAPSDYNSQHSLELYAKSGEIPGDDFVFWAKPPHINPEKTEVAPEARHVITQGVSSGHLARLAVKNNAYALGHLPPLFGSQTAEAREIGPP